MQVRPSTASTKEYQWQNPPARTLSLGPTSKQKSILEGQKHRGEQGREVTMMPMRLWQATQRGRRLKMAMNLIGHLLRGKGLSTHSLHTMDLIHIPCIVYHRPSTKRQHTFPLSSENPRILGLLPNWKPDDHCHSTQSKVPASAANAQHSESIGNTFVLVFTMLY